MFITWDTLSTDGSNKLSIYNDGPNTLLHELFHHLGLQHPFGPTNDAANSCSDDDYVVDTPTTLGGCGREGGREGGGREGGNGRQGGRGGREDPPTPLCG